MDEDTILACAGSDALTYIRFLSLGAFLALAYDMSGCLDMNVLMKMSYPCTVRVNLTTRIRDECVLQRFVRFSSIFLYV